MPDDFLLPFRADQEAGWLGELDFLMWVRYLINGNRCRPHNPAALSGKIRTKKLTLCKSAPKLADVGV